MVILKIFQICVGIIVRYHDIAADQSRLTKENYMLKFCKILFFQHCNEFVQHCNNDFVQYCSFFQHCNDVFVPSSEILLFFLLMILHLLLKSIILLENIIKTMYISDVKSFAACPEWNRQLYVQYIESALPWRKAWFCPDIAKNWTLHHDYTSMERIVEELLFLEYFHKFPTPLTRKSMWIQEP